MSQTIGVLFKVINYGVRYANEKNTPISSVQVLKMDYHTMRYSRIYTDACKD